MERLDGDHYQLSTGRKFYANNGIIGLAPDDEEPHYGYDGGIDCVYPPGDDEADRWTLAERVELADYMIAMWTEWKRRWS